MAKQKNQTPLYQLLFWVLLFLLMISGVGYFFAIHPLIDSDMERQQSRPDRLLSDPKDVRIDPVTHLVKKSSTETLDTPVTTSKPATSATKHSDDGLSGSHMMTGFVLQVTSLRQLSDAKREQKRLISKGFKARIESAVVEGQTYYRVQVVGDFANTQLLNNTKQRLREMGVYFIQKKI